MLPGKWEELTLRPDAANVNRLPQTGAIRPVALTIAGFDPSSGAGITADLKVFAAHRIYGVSAITALTVQSSQGVRRTCPVSGNLLAETLQCLAEDLPLTGVKIGMLGSSSAVGVVADFLRSAGIAGERIVLDPVIRSSSGAELLDAQGTETLRQKLLPMVGWVTPNVEELSALLGAEPAGRDRLPQLAGKLASYAPDLNVVVTGGHLNPPNDFLRTSGGEEHWFPGERVETTSTHGTGCAFSSALLCRLLCGEHPVEAVRQAKAFVTQALTSAIPMGKGRGPVTSGLFLD